MVNLDVCLEMVFCDRPYDERIALIAQCGYDSVEFWFHDATFDGHTCNVQRPKNAALLADVCRQHGVSVNNLVVNASDGSFGGSPVNADDYNCFIERLYEVIEFAKKIGCNKAITCTGNLQPHLTRQQMRENLEKTYAEAASIAEKNNFTLMLEPLNIHVDHAGYYLDSSSEAADIVRSINKSSFRLLYDIYHMQIMEGNIMSNIQSTMDIIGHFHSAAVPGRCELFKGELDYRQITQFIDAQGYEGRFGLELAPSVPDHRQALKEIRSYLGNGNGHSA